MKILRGFSGIISTLSLIVALSSCSDDPLNVGSNLLPDGDLLSASADTLITSSVIIKNPSFTYVSSTDGKYAPLGHVLDPIFGDTEVYSVMQFQYDKNNYYSKDTLLPTDQFVSCKLYLKIDNDIKYGQVEAFQIFPYQLAKLYSYGNSGLKSYEGPESDYIDLLNKPNPSLAEAGKISDSRSLDLDSTAYYLTVDLGEDYGLKLMDKSLIEEDSIYYNATKFLKKFPGLYLVPEKTSETGGLSMFTDKGSQIILSYRREGVDTLIHSVIHMDKYQSMYKNTYNNSLINDYIADSTEGLDQMYVQSLGGVSSYIKLDDLAEFKNNFEGKIGINLAELILPIKKSSLEDTLLFSLPKRLTVQVVDSKGNGTIISDDQVGPGYFNGFLNTDFEYRINISEFIYQYLQGDTELNELFIHAAELSTTKSSAIEFRNPGRVILNSGNLTLPPSERARIKIVYTRIY